MIASECDVDNNTFASCSSSSNTSAHSASCFPLPLDFFESNESSFRGRVRATHPDLQSIYSEITRAANHLVAVVTADFPANVKERDVVHDKNNNLIYLSNKPTKLASEIDYVHPMDRFGQPIHKRCEK